MSIKALQDYTFVSKYARYNKDKKRRESWEEAVERVKQMHLRKYPQVKKEIEWAFELVRQKRVLGSQRTLQFGGAPIEKHNARSYNCTVSYCDRLRFFQECFYLLLCGSGTGFSVQKHHIAKLPKFGQRGSVVKTYTIPDSIEGWADALGVLLSSYFESPVFPEYAQCVVKFDYSEIRPAGAPLASCSGKAPGAKPLRNALERIRTLLDRCKGDRLRTIDAYDIVMYASDAVLSGGVRRCLAQGSRVLTKDEGFKGIEDIIVGDKVSTPLGWKKVTNTFTQGKQEVITIKHQDGELICTPNHRVAVLKSCNGELEWKEASELIAGDRLFYKRTICDGSKNELPGWKYNKPLHSTTCKAIIIPDLDEEMAWLIGIIQGDGYVLLRSDKGEVSVAVEGSNPAQATLVKNQLERFGVNVRVDMPQEDNNCFRVRVKSKQLASYLYSYVKQPKEVLRIPEFIKCASPSIRLSFLQGVLDSDGCVKTRPQQAVCTVYKEFAKDIQSLYYSVGIVTRFKKFVEPKNDWQQKYIVSLINNCDKDAFITNVGFKEYSKGKISREANGFPMAFFEGEKPQYWSRSFCSGNKQINLDGYQRFYGNTDVVPIEVKEIKYTGKVIETYDIEVEDSHCFVCEGVLVHNSATISIFSPDDEDMLKAKTGNWFYDNSQRARSNNSCLLVRDKTTKEEFEKIMIWVREFGEPGFVWSDSTEMLVNPCAEISMHPVEETTGKSGWQACNLCEINGKKIKTEDDFVQVAKAGAILGTLQAGYTDFPYLGTTTENIVKREALLGVSITGMMENSDIIMNPEIQQRMAKLIKEVNAEIAGKIGINVAARTTAIKPGGTTSCMLGTSSGIHPHHAKLYFRRVQANKMEAPYKYFSNINPMAAEDSVWSANNTDGVITFCMKVPDKAKVKNDLSAIQLLEFVKTTQQNWVIPGTRLEACTQPWLTHNVSNTIQVKPEEWAEVTDYIYNNREYFAGISLLPSSGDKDYQQAPMCAIFTPQEIVAMYGEGSLLASGLIVDGLTAFGNNLWQACDAAMGLGEYDAIMDWNKKNPEIKDNLDWRLGYRINESKKDWIRRAKQFADRYFEGNTRKMTYCLKDVSNWKLWLDLNREYLDVDYTEMIEETDETNLIGEAACVGGACLI